MYFSKNQFVQLCELQDTLNTNILGTDWKQQPIRWSTAIFTEACEAINYLGWEWWKSPNSDTKQAQLEIIDMLHFAISGAIVNTSDYENLFDSIEDGANSMPDDQKVLMLSWETIDCCTEAAMHAVMGNYAFACYLCNVAANTLGMSSTEVFNMYIGKNVLNQFRKANGYKEGTYFKMWLGKEDNEYLTKIMDEHAQDNTTVTVEQLTAQLQEIYNNVCASAQH